LYFRELDAQQSLRGFGVQAKRGQGLAGAAVGEHDSQQQVLGSDVVVPQPLGTGGWFGAAWRRLI
jgi:hypothetical protein